MDHATQIALLRRIFDFLDQRTTEMAAAPECNSAQHYVAETRLAMERDRLFHQRPIFIGLSRKAETAGSYFTHSADGVPILAVRSSDGTLRAFLNVCRHRGAPVASAAGHCNGRFVCPYHGWTYDDGGRLLAQPFREGFAGISVDGLGLKPLPVAERYGMVFVRTRGDEPIDVDAHLAGAERELRPLGLERYSRFASQSVERRMNWKLVIDTFLEAYHVPSLHHQTLSPEILGSPALWDAFGHGGRMVVPRRTVPAMRQRPESEWNLLRNAVVLYHLFPNTMLIHQIDHVEVVQAYPGLAGADSAEIHFTLYTPEPVVDERARRHFQSNFDILMAAVEQEDFTIGQAIQRAFHAPGHAGLVYGRNEPGLAHFHRMIADALA